MFKIIGNTLKIGGSIIDVIFVHNSPPVKVSCHICSSARLINIHRKEIHKSMSTNKRTQVNMDTEIPTLLDSPKSFQELRFLMLTIEFSIKMIQV